MSAFLICEMVARCSCKIFDKFLSHFIIDTGRAAPLEVRGERTEEESNRLRKSYQNQLEEDLKEIAIQFLNLTVSNSLDSNKYWDKYIVPQCYYDFGYSLPLVEKKEGVSEPEGIAANFGKNGIPIGILCAACFHHFNLKMSARMYTNSPGETVFFGEDIEGFLMSSGNFSFQSLRILKLMDNQHQLLSEETAGTALGLIKIKVDLYEMLGNQGEAKNALIEYSESLLQVGDLDGCLAECKSAYNQVGPFKPESIRLLLIMLKLWIRKQNTAKIEETFKLASSLCTYNLGEHHPIHNTLRSMVA